MMIPATDDDDDGDDRRTIPTMIEVDHGGRTIPSVVAFIPNNLENGDEVSTDSHELLSMPPWAHQTTAQTMNVQWPNTSPTTPNTQYQIHIGKQAIHYEQHHPNSTFRNVKRIIGTGGKMAELAMGVVPNLFIESVNGNNIGDADLDDIFSMLEASDTGNKKSNKKGKKKRNNKGKKWKNKKASELPKLHKQLEDARDDPALLSCNMNTATPSEAEVLLRPEQISACILRKLYDTAEQYHQQGDSAEEVRVTRAVIGVPAYFTEAQRQATILASELAGVPKVKLLPEPEAAALAYGSANTDNNDGNGQYDNEELILVFDLGGGTFDVSILEVGGGVTEVLATVGNNRLGGTDFDKRVAEYLSGCAVEYGRKTSVEMSKKKKKDSLDRFEDDNVAGSENGRKKKRMAVVKDWFRQGSGEVPDIILRVAEEARKCLSNQKVVEVLVPLTEGGWREVAGGSDDGDVAPGSVIGPFDKTKLETERNMIEGDDYTIVELDRKTFESICSNELQLLLQPMREVAIMAGVLLPGDARPSVAENAMAMAREADGEDFWEFENESDFEDDDLLIKAGKDGVLIDNDSSTEDETLNEQALQQIQAMDIKSQKKAQQRGRRKARDIAKRERSFRKQKQSAMEEATTASLLGKQLDGSGNKQKRGGVGAATPLPKSVSVGNERVQEGIHGRPLSRIVLVGGATRMPVIGKLLEGVVGMVPQRTVHPDEAVALGCAVQVGILDGENEGLLGGMQAVLSPMQAAVMRALAKKRGMEVSESGELSMQGEEGMEMMMGGISGMMVVDDFDDEDDFY
ncbi:hypothetical protein ACHAXR_011368 [Thalassiosira sp. AJA248-18]